MPMVTKPNRDSFVLKYCLSVTAACVAETLTYPLDLVKARLQVQGEYGYNARGDHGEPRGLKAPTPHRGMLATATGIVTEEGLRKLWHGLTPALCRHLVYSGCRLSVYEALRDKVLLKNPDGTFPLWKATFSGACAGALGQLLASPADLIKVRLQMEGKRLLEGHAPRVKNTAHAFQQVVKEAGYRGLWSGCVPNVQRASLIGLGDLATYDRMKRVLLKHTDLGDNSVTHALASTCSGLVAALMGTPADVVKTRIMNQPTTEDGKGVLYRGAADCLMKTVRKEGVLALYKGLLPVWVRLASWSMTFWVSYERIRKATGTSAF